MKRKKKNIWNVSSYMDSTRFAVIKKLIGIEVSLNVKYLDRFLEEPCFAVQLLCFSDVFG